MVERADRLKILDQATAPGAPSPLVTPSLLNCDFSRVGEELEALKKAGAVAVHLDVMDGHFVPNLSYGPPVIADWRKRTEFPFDAHLMIQDPARYLEDYVKAGADAILVHIEVLPEPAPLLERIRDSGCRAGLVLNPPTPLESVLPWLDRVDKILVMSVMPGFGGQAFDASVLDKVRKLRELSPSLPIAIDGGIKAHNAAEVVAAGVTQLVVGSAIFRPDGNYAAALAEVVGASRRGITTRGRAPGAGASSSA